MSSSSSDNSIDNALTAQHGEADCGESKPVQPDHSYNLDSKRKAIIIPHTAIAVTRMTAYRMSIFNSHRLIKATVASLCVPRKPKDALVAKNPPCYGCDCR